ncbi:hypothetical protein OQA88_11168 [Cercophora sp. LCS_1]
MSLVKLPYELVSFFVIPHLDLADVWALSLTCKQLQFLVHEQNISKQILESKAPDTLEARTARVSGEYATELRRLVKRREATSSANPYLALILAVADSWLYVNGSLCHIRDRELRILDLHKSPSNEIVVDIRRMLDRALPESRKSTKYKFQPLYYSHGLLSCLYTHAMPIQTSWLVVFNPGEHRIVTTHRLDSAFKIFVRNDENFLCYGAYAPFGGEGVRRWMAGGYNLVSGKWLNHTLDFPLSIGSDIGSTISFEIFDGFFYCVSSQTSLEAEEKDWMSYYTCFRFPLTSEGFRKVDHAPRRQLWRRSHFEGPLDDRWSFLHLVKDETTGQLRIIEARKEWLGRNSSARRTYYTTEVVFGRPNSQGCSLVGSSSLGSGGRASSCKTNEPDFTTPPSRDPRFVHPGDDGATSLMFTLSKTPIRCYHTNCQTFLDLVDDPPSSEPSMRRVRLRAGTRRHWMACEVDKRKAQTPEGSQPTNTFDQQLVDLYKHEDVVFWPPEQDSLAPDAALAALSRVLSPPGHHGNICGTWDERTVIYAVEGSSGMKALVLLSFDPSIRLEGVQPFPRHPLSSSSATPHMDMPTSSDGPPRTAATHEGKGKGKGKERDNVDCHLASAPNSAASTGGSTAYPGRVGSGSQEPWRKYERAMYRDIAVGYHFAL